MTLKQCFMAVVCWACCSYSYSEVINTRTNNAASSTLNWLMGEVLPQHTGLVVTSVNYGYTAIKNSSDPFVVTVQNRNPITGGYIFRSTDDWTGRPGNTLIRTIPQPEIPGKYWGSGEITTTGRGELKDPFVIYSYRFDTCKQVPVTDRSCPNYIQLWKDTTYSDPLDDEYVRKSLERNLLLESEEERERNNRFMRDQQNRKSKPLSKELAKHALLTKQALDQLAAFEALNNIPNFSLYSVALPGGVYPETIKYSDRVLPDSRNAARLNLSQERLHNQLIELQYNLRGKND